MGVEQTHTMYSVKLDTDDMASADSLGGITQQRISTKTLTRGIPTSGDMFNRFLSIIGQNPGAAFSTMECGTALDNIALLGLKIAATTDTGVTLYAQKNAEGSTRATGGSHKSYNFQEGIIIPLSMRADHQGDCVIDYGLLASYDGTNNPIVISESVSLPTASTDAQRYTIGPVTLAGVSIEDYTSIEVDFGINARAIGAESDIWPTFAYIPTINPKITIRGINVGWLKTTGAIPLLGATCTHANTKVYWRARVDGGTTATDVTASHIKMTAAGIAYVDDAFDASADDDAETSIMLDMTYDGTNNPIVITTGSTIT